MIKKKRYLITTEDEATWKLDEPVIFLGEWCRLYDRKHIWKNMDAKVANPYGLEITTKDKDDQKVKNLEQKFLEEICKILNEHFQTHYSKRFWKIILGPWLRSITSLLLNRINTLKQCLDLEEISGTSLYLSDYSSLALPNLRSGFTYFYDDKKWNNILNGKILTLLDKNKISIDYIKYNGGIYSYQSFINNEEKKYKPLHSYLKDCVYRIYKKTTKKLVRKKDAFFINTYLNLREQIKLELKLGQYPQLWKKVKLNINVKPNQILRQKLTDKLLKKPFDHSENIFRNLLFELLPVCYLEGFKDMQNILSEQAWPNSPKFIFTSNSFGTDELFKLYTAIKTENGSKYYIGQHGNNYFTKRYFFPRIEEQTADKFFTWGWDSKLTKYIPMFIFKRAGINGYYDKNGGLLLIEQPLASRRIPWDVHYDYYKFFEEQKNFVRELDDEPMKKLIIRLSKSNNNKKLNEAKRWLEFNKELSIDHGKTNLNYLISKSRLVVQSYDTTGLLENLSQNIPTLAFWQNGLDHLRDSVKPDYKNLIDVGILHLSSKSVADKVNKIWNNIDEWWIQSSVQDARNSFCNKYAKNNDNPAKTLFTFFKNNNFN